MLQEDKETVMLEELGSEELIISREDGLKPYIT